MKSENPLKRFFDISFSLLVLTLCSPLFLLVAPAIYLSSRGSIFYAQPRMGKGGKVFKCYKFRTMHPDADEHLNEILISNPLMQLEWLKFQKLKNDPRVFPFGKWLRRTSLDELPQFWNVLKGDLSVVGPRPYMLCQTRDIGSHLTKILSVRPGVTGLWQTSGRNKRSFQERIELDARYVDSRSFPLDLFLILKTIPKVFAEEDAY